jgi:hypothetical protein
MGAERSIMATIYLTSKAKLNIQLTEGGSPLYARVEVEGLPLQPRNNLGGIYPNLEDIVEGLGFYGFTFTDFGTDETAESVGILSNEKLEEIMNIVK